jgi:aldose sugar dehydrogenase
VKHCVALIAAAGAFSALAGCTADGASARSQQSAFVIAEKGRFDEPWAMTFLPDGRALVTERAGALKIWKEGKASNTLVTGVPGVAYGGQGGFGDVVLHPEFAQNGLVYLSWAENGEGGKGAVVGRARLVEERGKARLEGLSVIWRQSPKVSGSGHFGHRIAFGPEGMLYISSGERQKMSPAQDWSSTLGKIVRLHDDGTVPKDNPYARRGGVAGQVWSLGHRNPLGLAFDPGGRLWNVEMGPWGGDELNLVVRAGNYGWPNVSNGSHYDGENIPDHRAGDGFEAPKVWWNPSISPGGMMIYTGTLFPKWAGDAFIAALGGQALMRTDLDGEGAAKAEQWDMGERIREVEQGPDGAIWLLEDGAGARLLKLTPRAEK